MARGCSFSVERQSRWRPSKSRRGDSLLVTTACLVVSLIGLGGLLAWRLNNKGQSGNQVVQSVNSKQITQNTTQNTTQSTVKSLPIEKPSSVSLTSERQEIERQRKQLEKERAELEQQEMALKQQKLDLELEVEQKEYERQRLNEQLEDEASRIKRENKDLEILLKIQESPELYIDQEFEVDVKIGGPHLMEIITFKSPDGKSLEKEILKVYRVALHVGPGLFGTEIGGRVYFDDKGDNLIFVTNRLELGREMAAKFNGLENARVKFKLIEKKYGVKSPKFPPPLFIGIVRNYWGVITSVEMR